MNEDDYKQERGADDEREERVPARSRAIPQAPYISLQGEGSWANLLTLLEVSPDALVLVDSTGRIAHVNSQTEALFGYLRSDIIGQPLQIVLRPR